MRARELLLFGKKVLEAAGLPSAEAERESLLILAYLLRIRPLEVYFYPEDVSPIQEQFQQILTARKKKIPLAYLLGEVEFFGRSFEVAPGVLIPRPETEILVEAVLQRLQGPAWILELGVGTGCVALTLAAEGGFYALGVEISPRALAVAQRNRQRLNLIQKVHWVRGDWLAPIKPGPRFEALVSNPPYVSKAEWPELSPEVRLHEPREALWGGEDGLDFIRKTLREAPWYLKPGGYVFLEIGYQQREQVARLARELGYHVEFVKDLLGHARVLVARRP